MKNKTKDKITISSVLVMGIITLALFVRAVYIIF